MVAVIAALLAEEARRREEGRADAEIPMRPDHGQDILDDLKRGAQPGYPAIGRLKGLAELRGVMALALSHPWRQGGGGTTLPAHRLQAMIVTAAAAPVAAGVRRLSATASA